MEFDIENLLHKPFDKQEDCKVIVSSTELKILFAKLKQFFNKSEHNCTIRLHITEDKIVVRASDALHLLATLKVQEFVDGVSGMTANYVFSDIEKMIAGSGNATLILSTKAMQIKCSGASLILHGSMTQLQNIDFDVDYKNCVIGVTSLTLDSLKMLSPLSKYYHKYPPIQVTEKFLQIKYPSIYIQGPASGPRMNMSYSYLYLLNNLLFADAREASLQDSYVFDDEDYDSDEEDEAYEEDEKELSRVTTTVQYAKKKSTVFFKNEGFCLSMVVAEDEDSVSLLDKIKDFDYIGNFEFKHVYSDVKKLQQSIGEGDVDVAIYDTYITLQCTRNGNMFTSVIGEMSECNRIIAFRYRIELLTPILGYIGDSFELYKKGGLICLRSEDYLIMMSVLS